LTGIEDGKPPPDLMTAILAALLTQAPAVVNTIRADPTRPALLLARCLSRNRVVCVENLEAVSNRTLRLSGMGESSVYPSQEVLPGGVIFKR